MKYTLCMSSLRSFYVNQFYLWVLLGYCTLDMYKETSTQTNKRRGDLFFALYLVSVVEDEQWGQNHCEVAFLYSLKLS